MNEKRDILLVHGSDEWSALYVDGKLDRVGDHYLADERIRELCGVQTEWHNDFMQGGEYRESVAQTVEEMRSYTNAREAREREAARLREQAAELERQAAELLTLPIGVKR